MPFEERDVSRDPAAARELARQSGQMGVPVITGAGQVITGFDQPRLEQLVASVLRGGPATQGRGTSGLRLGARVKSVSNGAEVGAVHPGSAAERAGLRVGDVIVSAGGRSIASAASIETLLPQLDPGRPLDLEVLRAGRRINLTVS